MNGDVMFCALLEQMLVNEAGNIELLFHQL